LLLPPVASAAECTDTYIGGSEGAWSSKANWSAGRVPTETDVACIGSGETAVVSTNNNKVATLQGEGTLKMTAGSLSLEAEALSVISSVSETGNAALKGRGDLEITGSLLLQLSGSASMVGPGTTVLANGADAVIGAGTTNDVFRLSGRDFINDGVIHYIRGRVVPESEALFENNGTVAVESVSTVVTTFEGSGGHIVNNGIIERLSGSGTTSIQGRIENNGRIFAGSGTIKVGSNAVNVTGSPGSVWAGNGGKLIFHGTSFFLDECQVEGQVNTENAKVTVEGLLASAAQLTIDSDTTLTVSGSPSTFYSLVQEGGNITGAGTLEITKTLKVKSQADPKDVEMTGAGTTVIAPGASAEIGGGVNSSIFRQKGRTLVNEGTLNFSRGHWVLSEGAQILTYGVFDADPEGSSSTAIEGAKGGRILNTGMLERTGGAGTTYIGPPLRSSGAIRAYSGDFEIVNPINLRASDATPSKCKPIGDPVDCVSGDLTEAQTDIRVGGRGVGLDLGRFYSAQSAAAGTLGIFGYGWGTSFGDKLTSEEGGTEETLETAAGGTTTFAKVGASWSGPSWSKDVLTGSAEAGFGLVLPSGVREKFSGSGRLEAVIDRNGNETGLTYGGTGDLEAITDPCGRKITLTYNAEGLVETAKDPMGREVKYVYESKNLKSVTFPGDAAPAWQFGYDASRRLTSMTDGRGGKTTNEYDSSNRVISQTDPAGRKTTFAYDGFHTTITNKATGSVTDEWFNSNNQPTSVTHGFGTASATTTTLTYTAAGLLSAKTDGNGHTTSFEYDARGNRIKETDPEGDETRWTFDEVHQLLTATTPNGEKTTITRNANGDPETILRPALESKTQTVSFEYGPHGEVETMTDPLGHVWSYKYDKYGDRAAAIDPEGDERTWAFNEDSQVTSTVSPRGNEEGAEPIKFTTAIERDLQGRPIKVTDPLGGVTKYAYDADGNVESVTDPNGRKTKFTHDADNEQTKVELPNGAIEETGYDGAGQVTSQTDGNKHETTYVRNVLEQPIETADPLERKTVRTFDAAGNLKTLKDPDGRTTTYAYDKADRLTGVSYSDGVTPNAVFGYDEDGNLTSMIDGTGTSTYGYDQLGRLVASEDGNGETVAWEYNLGDQPVGLTYPNGESIVRAYDDAGRLDSVTDWLGHTTSFGYNADSAPTLTTFPVGTGDTDQYGYDRAGRMASATMKQGAETLTSLTYSRDPAGQLESLVSKGLPGPETEAFSYDENERLKTAGGATYEYDAANNITEAPGTTNAYDKASQIASATGASFTFDKEGDRTKLTPSSGPGTTYKYDQAGDLGAIGRAEEGETPAIAESFAYDGTGLLASRTVGLETHHLVWDPGTSPEALLSDGEDSFIYGPGGLPVEQISSSEVPNYLHHDQLGSTRLLTNASGGATGTFTYEVYGALTGHTGTATTALGYAGQYTLGQSGLSYLRARFYDPATAQFLSLDPLVSGTRAPYFYAGDNPANRRDRTGASEEALEFPCVWPCGPPPSSVVQPVEEVVDGIGGFLGGLVSPGAEAPPLAPGALVEDLVRSTLPGIREAEVVFNDADSDPCDSGWNEGKNEIGDKGERRREDEQFLEGLDRVGRTNQRSPGWPPSGSRFDRFLAVLGRLLGEFHH
jgi:RHS repeat-associated protein